jgi:exopolysaccharide/PEP-CTERM locus tyrosine autokinase
MSLIERAAKRLEELRKAGVDYLPEHAQEPVRAAPPPRAIPVVPVPTPLAQPVRQTLRRFDLNLDALAAAGFVTPTASRSRISEEFRVIKRPLLTNTSEKRANRVPNANLIMVTSAVPGEGKTFTAVNLAISIASELNRTVLLVDADVARPSFPHVLGIPTGPGLMDVLGSEHRELADVLMETNVDKLSILSSGNPHAQATELLASNQMSHLLDEMSSRYPDRIVIFDSPPLLVTTEARELASHMGQIVVVVHAESTVQTDVKKALATIEQCPIKMMLLNQARTFAQGSYGYGYGYGA